MIKFKINKIINKFLLTGDTFMPKMHLKQSEFTNCTCEPFTKHFERIQKFGHTDCLKHLYKSKLDNAWFAQDAEYSDCKDLAKRAIPDNYLKDGGYEIARNCKYDGYQRTLATSNYGLENI